MDEPEPPPLQVDLTQRMHEHQMTKPPTPRKPEDTWSRRVAATVAGVGLVVVLVPAFMHVSRMFNEDPFIDQSRTEVIVRVDHGQTVTTTTGPQAEPLIVRALGGGGLLLLRLGFVALAAFAAGASTQRIIAADFAGKFGPFELGKASRAARASSITIEQTARRLDREMKVTRRAANLALDAARQVAALERRVGDLEGPAGG